MVTTRLRALASRLPTDVASVGLAHDLKNDIVGKINHYGVSLENQIAAIHENLTQQLGLMGARLGTIEEHQREHQEAVTLIAADLVLANERLLEMLARVDRYKVSADGLQSTQIDHELSTMLNVANSADGPLRESGLFINGPLNIQWRPGGPTLAEVNERVIEYPYVISRLADLTSGSRVLDVGGGESTLGLGLASRGLRVDLVEPGGVPFRHPNLTVHHSLLEETKGLETPDAIVLLSAIEHFGIGAYGHATSEDLDLEAMRFLWGLAGPHTQLVLTTPFGSVPDIDDLQRTYDRERLTTLLRGWRVDDVRVARQLDDHTWVEENGLEPAPDGRRTAALISATRAASADATPW